MKEVLRERRLHNISEGIYAIELKDGFTAEDVVAIIYSVGIYAIELKVFWLGGSPEGSYAHRIYAIELKAATRSPFRASAPEASTR